MKYYDSVGPNPHIVRMFMAERGVSVPSETIDLRGGANRQEPYLSINPAGQMPALVLDDGSVITEVTAICEYLDEVSPGAKLMGETPEARAQVRRWTRWADLNILEPMLNGFRFGEGLALFESRMRLIPEASTGLKACAQDKLEWLDAQLGTRAFVAGDDFSLADILLYCGLAFGGVVGQPLNPELKNIAAWFAKVAARPSASA